MGKKTEQSKIVYDKMALEYDEKPEGFYTKAHKEELLRKVVLSDGDTILDVACGNGYLLSELSKKAKVKAFGVDIAKAMIAVAKKRYPECDFQAQPCFPLEFENNTVDVITVSCAFHHFEDPQGFADECKRVLKDGGEIYLAEPYFTPLIRFVANAFVFPFTHSGDVKVYSAKELCSFFKKAGFSKMRTYEKGTIQFFTAMK